MKYVLIVLALAAVGCAKKFPAGWSTCKMSDPKYYACMRNAIQGTLPDLVKGMPKFGIKTIDPLNFQQITIKQGSGPISLDLVLNDVDILGIHTGTVNTVKNNNWKVVSANVSVPVLTAKVKHYTMNGKILVLPIKGDGKAKLTLDNFRARITLNMVDEERGGKTYMRVDKMKFEIDCDKFHQEYENLFDGNKQLADQMKIFLEENQREVFKELSPAIGEAISAGLLQLSNRLFSKIPKDEIVIP